MKHKKLSVFITAFALIAAVMIALPTTAYAKGGEADECEYECEIDQTQTETVLPVIPEEEAPEPTPPREPQTLTPPGNLNLVDDFDGELAEDKQFITVVTRNGHFFYIIIDRAGERNNVHFLNQVDEYDLWAILNEEAPRPTTPAPVEPLPEIVPDTEAEPEPQPEQESGGNGGLVIVIVLLLAIGGGAYYYFKILKPKQGTTGTTTTDLDEFVFDDDEDDLDGTITDEPDSTDFEDDMPDFTADPADFESEDRE